MRRGAGDVTVGHMDLSPRRTRARSVAAALLLVLTAAVGALFVTVVYGLSKEYGDTAESILRTGVGAIGQWALGLLVVGALATLAVAASHRQEKVRVLAGLLVVGTVAAVPVAAVLGVHDKYAGYPALPHCTAGIRSGPALPVVRASQRVFAELEHPARFSGGGSSGVDGCVQQLMVRDGIDPRAGYRDQLRDRGWRVVEDGPEALAAEKDGQRFELVRDELGWTVGVGPTGVERPAEPAEGAVRPRTATTGEPGDPRAGYSAR